MDESLEADILSKDSGKYVPNVCGGGVAGNPTARNRLIDMRLGFYSFPYVSMRF